MPARSGIWAWKARSWWCSRRRPKWRFPQPQVEAAIHQALAEAEENKISGAAVTPFLLERVSQLSGGASLQANLALLRNNARLAAQIALRSSRADISRACQLIPIVQPILWSGFQSI